MIEIFQKDAKKKVRVGTLEPGQWFKRNDCAAANVYMVLAKSWGPVELICFVAEEEVPYYGELAPSARVYPIDNPKTIAITF